MIPQSFLICFLFIIVKTQFTQFFRNEFCEPNALLSLHLAAELKDETTVQTLLKWGANVYATDYDGRTPLDRVKKHRQNFMDTDGRTLLDRMVEQEAMNIDRSLDIDGCTATDRVVQYGQAAMDVDEPNSDGSGNDAWGGYESHSDESHSDRMEYRGRATIRLLGSAQRSV